jgi:hypothetical protein
VSKTQRFFRYVWRANAVLILLGTAAICVSVGSFLLSELLRSTSRHQDVSAAPPVVGPESGEQLFLGQLAQVEGTDTLRGELLASGSGSGLGSSGYGSATRNVLFLDVQSKAARWLLQDSRHVISQSIDVRADVRESNEGRRIAEVILVKAVDRDASGDEGTLLLLDPTGRTVTTIAADVRAVNHAQLSIDGQINVLYERNRKYVLAKFDPTSLERQSEDELDVPQLK